MAWLFLNTLLKHIFSFRKTEYTQYIWASIYFYATKNFNHHKYLIMILISQIWVVHWVLGFFFLYNKIFSEVS